jgi:hypothetical protein
MEVLKNGPSTVESLQLAFERRFSGSLQQQEDAYTGLIASASSDGAPMVNHDCRDAVNLAKAWTETATTHLAAVERYVAWNIPRMEDGGNFGVTVQLAVIKHIQDLAEKLAKGADELAKYPSARADALDKCKQIGSTTQARTSSTSTTESAGGKEEGKETKTSVEEKTATTSADGPDGPDRLSAVVATDCLYWYKAKLQVQAIVTGYVSALDYLEKNATKLAEPKGSQGSGGHFSSMY